MKTVITATIPTVYDMKTLSAFGLGKAIENPDGSFTATGEFSSIEEAQAHLAAKADEYYDGEEVDINRNLDSNSLRLGTITANIAEVD